SDHTGGERRSSAPEAPTAGAATRVPSLGASCLRRSRGRWDNSREIQPRCRWRCRRYSRRGALLGRACAVRDRSSPGRLRSDLDRPGKGIAFSSVVIAPFAGVRQLPEPPAAHFSFFLVCENAEPLSGGAQLLFGEAFRLGRFLDLFLRDRFAVLQ